MPAYLLLILLIPFQTHPLLSQNLFGFTVIKWVGLVAVLSALAANHGSGRSPRLLWTIQGRFFVLLLGIVFLNWFFEWKMVFIDPAWSYLSFAVFFFLTLSMVSDVSKARAVMWAVALCMLAASLYIIKEYIVFSRIYGPNFRPFGGAFRDPNYFALSALMALPAAYYLMKTSRERLKRLFLFGVLALYGFAMVLSLSRGAFVGLAGMGLVAVLVSGRRSKTLLVLLAFAVIGAQLAPERLWKRFEGTRIVEDEKVYGDTASTTRRWFLYKAGVAMIAEHPLKGVGIGRFKPLSLYYEPTLGERGVAHNTYLEIAAELGLPALALFVGIMGFTIRDLIRLRRRFRDDPDLRLLSEALILSLTGFAVSCLFLSGQDTKLYWLTVFLTIAITRALQRRAEAQGPAPALSEAAI